MTLSRAALGYLAVALFIGRGGITGSRAFGPETLLDRNALYSELEHPHPPFGDGAPIQMDYPRDLAFAEGLRDGRVDHWNPLVGFGAPLWAEQGGPFFPLKLAFYAAPSPETYNIFLLLRLVAAALGAFALGRARGLSPQAAFVSGLIFELSGVMISQIAYGTTSPLCVLPWALLGALAISRQTGWAAVAGAAVALGAAGHGGHPSFVIMIFLAFAVACAGYAVRAYQQPRVALRILGQGALAGLLGLAIAAPSLLPLLELAGQAKTYKSERPAAEAWQNMLIKNRGVFPISVYAPEITLRLREINRWLWPWPYGSTLGVAGYVLALAGVLCLGLDAGLLAVGLVGILLTLSPVGLWVGKLPGARYLLPAYTWALLILPLTHAAGHVIERLGEPRTRRRLLLAGGIILAGMCTLLLMRKTWIPKMNLLAMFRQQVQSDGGIFRLFLSPAIAAVVVVASWRLGRTRWARLAGLGGGAVVALELAFLTARALALPPSAALRAPANPAVKILQAGLADGMGRMNGVPFGVGMPHTPMLFGLRDLRNVSALPLSRLLDYLHEIRRPPTFFTEHSAEVDRGRLLDLASARFLLTDQERKIDAGDLVLIYFDRRKRIYRNPSALPRARVVHRVLAVPTQAVARSLLRLLKQLDDLGVDEEWALVEPGQQGGRLPPLEAARPGAGETVHLREDAGPDRVALEVHVETRGLLVLADSYYQGWEAWVDGQPAEIFPVDVAFRGVLVTPGDHRVELRYRSRAFVWGVGAMCAALAVCAFLWRWRRG